VIVQSFVPPLGDTKTISGKLDTPKIQKSSDADNITL